MLNGQKRKFSLDTGVPNFMLNSEYCAQDTSLKTLSYSQDVNGDISNMNIQKLKPLDFGSIQLIDEDVITRNLTYLEKELEWEIYDLVGYELIKDYDILIDYKNKMLTLIAPSSFESYKNNNLTNKQLETIKFQMKGQIPVIQAKVNGKILNLGIDRGAEENLIDVDLFHTLRKSVRKVKKNHLIDSENNRTAVKKGQIKKIQIGDRIFKKQMSSFGDISHLNEGCKIKIDGLIGFPILSKQKTLISFERKELIFID